MLSAREAADLTLRNVTLSAREAADLTLRNVTLSASEAADLHPKLRPFGRFAPSG